MKSGTQKGGNAAVVALSPEIIKPIIDRIRQDDFYRVINKKPRPARRKLTKGDITEHLNGGVRCGGLPICPGESTTRVAVLDFDSHKGESSWGEMQKAAIEVCSYLCLVAEPISFRSSGGRGVHVYLLWDKPQDAYSVREFLKSMLKASGFTEGAAGIAKGQVEIFPKQSEVAVGGYGSMFVLPLAGKSAALDAENMGVIPAESIKWGISGDVSVLKKGESTAVVQISDVDSAIATKALWAIPNDGSEEALDSRDFWLKILCAYKEAVGEDGKSEAESWSAQHESYDERRFLACWDSIIIGKEGGAPAAHLFTVASIYGFTEHVLAGFDVVSVAGELVESLPAIVFNRRKDGRAIASRENIQKALSRFDLCDYRFRFDSFFSDYRVKTPGDKKWRALADDDYQTVCLTLESGDCGFEHIPKDRIRDAMLHECQLNQIDSAVRWIDRLVWDSVPRVTGLLSNYFGAEETPYTAAVSEYFMTALCGRITEPGIQADMVPVGVGGQGLRKSSLIAAIAPFPDSFVDLDIGEGDAELARKMRGKLVAELGEMKGLRNREMEHVKQFITRRFEEWVPKYMEQTTRYYRRCMFFGTTNKDEFLEDETGHRRWLPFNVGDCAVEKMLVDRDQLYAEGLEMFKNGGIRWQNAERLAKNEHHKFVVEDLWDNRVLRWLDSTDEMNGLKNADSRFRAVDVLDGIGIPQNLQTDYAKTRIKRILSRLGFEQKLTRVNTQKMRVYTKN